MSFVLETEVEDVLHLLAFLIKRNKWTAIDVSHLSPEVFSFTT